MGELPLTLGRIIKSARGQKEAVKCAKHAVRVTIQASDIEMSCK